MNNEEKMRAAELLGVQEKYVSDFSVIDPFNDNLIEGEICRKEGNTYGTLVIHRVNGTLFPVPQIVYGTPKLQYPFGRVPEENLDREARRYTFQNHRYCSAYEKLDGTNILVYSYKISPFSENEAVTYKTRLTPVLKEGKFGDFVSLWREILQRYPILKNPPHVSCNSFSLSFEMFGYRNPILVSYDVPLDTRLLFGVHRIKGILYTPDWFKSIPQELRLSALYYSEEENSASTVYRKMQKEVTESSTFIEDENRVLGKEGYVFYVSRISKYSFQSLYKCKSEKVEDIHFANEDYISKKHILPTVWNCLENISDLNELTPEFVSSLLEEEFSSFQIKNSHERIVKAISFVKNRLRWREEVMSKFQEENLKAVVHSKEEILRSLSSHFNRSDMKEVFNALKEMHLV